MGPNKVEDAAAEINSRVQIVSRPSDQISNSKHPLDGARRAGTAAVAPDNDSVAPRKQL